MNAEVALETEPDRPVEHGVSAFLTDRLIEWIERQDGPWFAHASYLRPASSVRGRRALVHASTTTPTSVSRSRRSTTPTRSTAPRSSNPVSAAPTDPAELRHLRRQYFGMISDVDAQLGRVWDCLAGDRGVGQHLHRGDRRPRRAARRPRPPAEGRVVRGEPPHRRHRARPVRRRPTPPAGPSSSASPRTSTSSPRCARRWASRSPCSATGCRSPRCCTARSRRGGGTPPTGSSTGATRCWPSARTSGRGTGGSSGSTSPCAAPSRSPTCSSGTARGSASTSPPTRRGAPR